MSFHATPPVRWRKSRRCGASMGCVEVARLDHGTISVRDTEKATDILSFGVAEWRRFVGDVERGRFDQD
ncbi:DUF397 domain-containing protein [Actinomadura sp. WMMB 499]|uniref:DUF397 domain-containing protein n=1 Tax=Actinomadura sp. WMMB 499 TaxID=1219491 RepID=UPI0012477172|nr:DUF397 domain-containing protein [Actinomadura sp. WMMB 499]QFG23952.1 DUF397 domain-containing protein [Actinomadura sp. WMMB 499]